MKGLVFFDTSQVHAASKGFSGAACDGRYIYYVPMNNGTPSGQVTRYDSQGRFDDPASWSFFDTTTVHADSRGFTDGLFDGRYLYMVPYFNGLHHGQVTRYDTRAPFADPASWCVFDTRQLDPESRGFVSGVVAGRHLYLAPYQLDWSTYHGRIVRYDTQADFNTTTSWDIFDAARLQEGCQGYHSAVADGRHVYFVPYRGNKDFHGHLVRFDSHGRFDDPQAWTTFDLTTLHPQCRGFIGAVRTDRHLCFVPYYDGTDRHGQVARYEIGSRLDARTGWQVFDMARVHPNSRGFFGALFDQRYIYFIPHCIEEGIYHGQVSRFDTTKPLDDLSAWAVCDTARVYPLSKGYIGGVIVGRHLYMSPYETAPRAHTGVVVRIDLDEPSLWEYAR
ncbi:MAG: hypothetical protein H7833_05540 [Magnetococcus sp. DMHC-1]